MTSARKQPRGTVQLVGSDGVTPAPDGSPLAPIYVATAPGTTVNGQIKIAATNTAVQIPAAALINGLIIKARSANAGKGFVGGSSVTTTDDGTGSGYGIAAGEAWSGTPANASSVWVNGTAGDIFYYTGS